MTQATNAGAAVLGKKGANGQRLVRSRVFATTYSETVAIGISVGRHEFAPAVRLETNLRRQ